MKTPPGRTDARRLFALHAPRAFIARMEKGNPDDPLTSSADVPMNLLSPRFLHRPAGRATLCCGADYCINTKPGAIAGKRRMCGNRRYCSVVTSHSVENQYNKRNWTVALEYIAAHPELMRSSFRRRSAGWRKDHELDWLLTQLPLPRQGYDPQSVAYRHPGTHY